MPLALDRTGNNFKHGLGSYEAWILIAFEPQHPCEQKWGSFCLKTAWGKFCFLWLGRVKYASCNHLSAVPPAQSGMGSPTHDWSRELCTWCPSRTEYLLQGERLQSLGSLVLGRRFLPYLPCWRHSGISFSLLKGERVQSLGSLVLGWDSSPIYRAGGTAEWAFRSWRENGCKA